MDSALQVYVPLIILSKASKPYPMRGANLDIHLYYCYHRTIAVGCGGQRVYKNTI